MEIKASVACSRCECLIIFAVDDDGKLENIEEHDVDNYKTGKGYMILCSSCMATLASINKRHEAEWEEFYTPSIHIPRQEESQ